ncbi:hypothetical protein COC42_09970 [Sphingomonas spermidinifaciens]|uniref:DUF4287 domain-containing protein n=1 Tax=Sphingomonas spermidinifaciens TaxID=1141889 RepID=A0A2A4BA91_9SPHN|nr:DUF4287 domain-containing protein [Sphingomonas spermidinifaciens]PCD04554.1 hypothetical protein COC42_09970 [Sphingomonas spermidinifaciens]
MSFQSYLTSIEAKTGRRPDDFRREAAARGLVADGVLAPGVTAKRVTEWLKADHGLGHGHAMAIYALLTGRKKEGDE